jgi:hypothetical protein
MLLFVAVVQGGPGHRQPAPFQWHIGQRRLVMEGTVQTAGATTIVRLERHLVDNTVAALQHSELAPHDGGTSVAFTETGPGAGAGRCGC